ncbi:uncharacterized protein LOC131323612 [Rhododendron vialii]|uniref:uncharacterized protein LOC131323612 n=1 Tax=Rhododendron vialii TaxID=182163 RepID=UPI00265F464E|nr:uncharacterized protein LOC131323612 [Rhododendron vialii]
MGMFFKNLGLTASTHVDPSGRKGGIWILWDPSKVSLNTTLTTPQAIHTTVRKDNFEDWIFSAVYGSRNPRIREILWEELGSLADTNQKPWLIAGDFNDTAEASESKSNAPDTSASQRRKFMDNINKCQLIDLGYMGAKYTWTNGRLGLANVQKRLDRALSNEEWRSLFPEGNVKLNTNGCWYESNGTGGFGGLFRNHMGDWIMEYYGKRSFHSSLEAELWSTYKGLEVILERKLENVKIESDSLVAMNLTMEGNPGNHPQSVLINEIHALLTQTNTTIGHISRSANQCADHLARMGAERTEELVFVMDMPIAMREFVIRDSLNIRQVLD